MKEGAVLLGSVESELSEFSSVREIRPEQLTVASAPPTTKLAFTHNKKIKIGLAVVGMLLFLWFGPRALIKGVLWLTHSMENTPFWITCVVQFVLVVGWSVLCIPFPSSIEILSGFVLGFFWGSVVNVFGLFSTAALSFLIGRKYLRSTVRTWLTSNAPRLQSTCKVIETRGLKFLILFRLLVIPFWARNYGPAALLDCTFRDFAISVLIGTCPFGFFYAYIGDRSREISEELAANRTQSHWVEGIVVVVGLCITLYVSIVALRIFQSAETAEPTVAIADQPTSS